MDIVVLDASTYGEGINLDIFKKFGSVTFYETTPASLTFERIKDADIVITNKVVIDKTILEKSPKLKLICIGATGMNNIDLSYAKEKNVEVKNVSGYSTHSVVQHTLSMVLYLASHSCYFDEYVKSREWQKSEIFTHLGRSFFEIKDKSWGIIGLGAIGKEVASVASALGATIQYYSTSGDNKNSTQYNHVELETLLKTSDIISIHSPLNEKTKNLINSKNLKFLKSGAILINVGRGGIINENDLALALDSSKIYAGLDVLEHEPMKENHPLLNIKDSERLYITPHIAWTSIEARQTLIASIAKNIELFLKKD